MYTIKVLIPFVARLRATHWDRSVVLLRRTIESVLFQNRPGAYVVLIGHDEVPLPGDLICHDRFQLVKVDYDPSCIHPSDDKSYKLAYGLMASKHIESVWQMALDADDVLQKNVAGWLAHARTDVVGFIIARGYQFDYWSNRGYPCGNLQRICGSSIILRSDLVKVPQSYEETELRRCIWFRNGHLGIPSEMDETVSPLEYIPFRALLYTVNHGGDWHKIYKRNRLIESIKRLIKFSPFLSVSPKRLRYEFRID